MAKKVKITHLESLTDHLEAVTLVPITNKKNVNTVQANLIGLTQEQTESIDEKLSSGFWRGTTGHAIFEVDSKKFLCVPYPIFKNKAQCSREFGLIVASQLKSLRVEELVILNSNTFDQGQLLAGLVNGFYVSSGFKKQKEETVNAPTSISFLGADGRESVAKAHALSKAQIVARHLGDAPANWLNPARFAEVALELAGEFGFKVKVLAQEEIISEKMGALMAVARGSANEPKVIVIEIPGESDSKTTALVGKGLTFDSGGISLKPGAGMEEMKYDMCGGAAVFGAACYLAQVKPKYNVVALIGAVENMPGSDATRPGDVVRSRSGKTVEVINTDAEGRLVLIDVLDYAITNYKPDLLVNVATLTGACLVALGSVGAAVLSKKQNVANMLLERASEVGEPLWQLPLWEELVKEVKSDVADYKNITSGNVKAGTITAGIFLSEFVGDANWAHLDIAGTGWNCAAAGLPKKGGSGYGVALLADACSSLDKI